jgi:hypothetical protein
VPIEKLFMTTIGFSPASVGVMAAVYAVVVPVLEVPSGVLADRWSTHVQFDQGFEDSAGPYLLPASAGASPPVRPYSHPAGSPPP